ncbi:MAG TPA: PASTA domain-containing protein [Acidimicrobiales bacterium]|nr:PASTA domain-containing protein [Acidimicrobiales bacterium]
MSDHDPTQPIDPTRAEPPVRGPADEPTSVFPAAAGSRTAYETTTTTGPPPQPPGRGGVSTGAALAAAVLLGLLGLLVGYLLWGTDDDGTTTEAVEDTVPAEPGADEALVAERDQLAQQVQDQQTQIDDLQRQLDEVTAERDELQSQVDDTGDEVVTVPAPDVTAGSVEDAQATADENGWTLVAREVPADGEEPGTVVAQYPDPGTPMIEGSVLAVDVAADRGPDAGVDVGD